MGESVPVGTLVVCIDRVCDIPMYENADPTSIVMLACFVLEIVWFGCLGRSQTREGLVFFSSWQPIPILVLLYTAAVSIEYSSVGESSRGRVHHGTHPNEHCILLSQSRLGARGSMSARDTRRTKSTHVISRPFSERDGAL